MADVPEETAERLALRARRSMDRGDFPAAIEQQYKAVKLRERELDGLDLESSALADERKEAAHRLSDYWGRLGGIYRRDRRIPEAIEAYFQGKEIERQYRIDDTYNLTNWIVLQLLEDPARLEELISDIYDAIALLRVQVEGPRRDQWWALADLGLLCLLGGRPREAREAYERFQQAGPRPVDYQSVLEVLGSLQKKFQESEPERAAELSNTIKYLQSASVTS